MTRPTVYIAALMAAACSPYPQRIHHPAVLTNADMVPETGITTAGVPAGVAHPGAPAPVADHEVRGQALLEQGDELVAFGRFDEALDRYNRASVLIPGDPIVDFRIARVLDVQMQHQEAAMRYRRFLHALELEKIEARGAADARLAEAIAIAQQRLIILDKR